MTLRKVGPDHFKHAISAAPRLCGENFRQIKAEDSLKAEPQVGQILASTAVAELCRGKNIAFVDTETCR